MKKLVLLIDIDGTLVLTGGAGQHAIGDVITEQRDSDCWNGRISFAGRTDRSIMHDFFDRYEIAATEENFQEYRERYLVSLRQYLVERDGYVLPAVKTTLDCLSEQENVVLGLLTGNLRRAAWMKLKHYDLESYFYTEETAVGGFGDHRLDRDDVARDALQEVRDRVVPHVEPQDVWVVGDTPNDVKCARAIEANVMAVATGSFTVDQLRAANADFVVETLEEASEWWQRLEVDYGIQTPASI